MSERKLVPETMTPDQARDLLNLKCEYLPAEFRQVTYEGI
jgi:hypothetical protein